MSKNMVSRGTSVLVNAPDRAASLAMKVIDNVFTTPYRSHTSSQAQ